MTEKNAYPTGFETDDALRSAFIRQLILKQLHETTDELDASDRTGRIPKRLVRYWHDLESIPADVRTCLATWDCLANEGFELHLFDDLAASAYIRDRYGDKEMQAFRRCDHPAMRCDYFRLCWILAEGGLYVDADDVLVGGAWRQLFWDDRLKLQPFCYDVVVGRMVDSSEIWRADAPERGRIFYVNNDPIVSPPGHPLVQRALLRATGKLLETTRLTDIQSTTGPGNLSAALAAHARELHLAGSAPDYELLRNWDQIAEVRWDLTYRNDSRNWRNYYGC